MIFLLKQPSAAILIARITPNGHKSCQKRATTVLLLLQSPPNLPTPYRGWTVTLES